MKKQKQNNFLNKLTITLIFIGQILMLAFFFKETKKYNYISFLQIIGIINGAFYAYAMFVNKAKLTGICGFIFNLITAITMFYAGLYALFLIRIYGIFLTLYLIFTGKDFYQNNVSYKNELLKIVIVTFLATIIYFYFGKFSAKGNILLISLDFSALIVVSIALMFHAKQSIKQYHFWFLSNIINLIIAILKINIYLICVFSFWTIIDTINWINWHISKNLKK